MDWSKRPSVDEALNSNGGLWDAFSQDTTASSAGNFLRTSFHQAGPPVIVRYNDARFQRAVVLEPAARAPGLLGVSSEQSKSAFSAFNVALASAAPFSAEPGTVPSTASSFPVVSNSAMAPVDISATLSQEFYQFRANGSPAESVSALAMNVDALVVRLYSTILREHVLRLPNFAKHGSPLDLCLGVELSSLGHVDASALLSEVAADLSARIPASDGSTRSDQTIADDDLTLLFHNPAVKQLHRLALIEECMKKRTVPKLQVLSTPGFNQELDSAFP